MRYELVRRCGDAKPSLEILIPEPLPEVLATGYNPSSPPEQIDRNFRKDIPSLT
jgi:hypothetical protein